MAYYQAGFSFVINGATIPFNDAFQPFSSFLYADANVF